MKTKTTSSDVEIYGQRYKIKGVGGEQYIAELSFFVDKKMREISEHTPTVDSLKVAILAAINIADELFKLKRKLERTEKAVAEKTEKFDQLLKEIN
jgi:cell division protein ZapA